MSNYMDLVHTKFKITNENVMNQLSKYSNLLNTIATLQPIWNHTPIKKEFLEQHFYINKDESEGLSKIMNELIIKGKKAKEVSFILGNLSTGEKNNGLINKSSPNKTCFYSRLATSLLNRYPSGLVYISALSLSRHLSASPINTRPSSEPTLSYTLLSSSYIFLARL